MENEYESLKTLVMLWSLTKWEDCSIICLNELSIRTADIIVSYQKNLVGFIFIINKPPDFIKRQLINCIDTYDIVYLITNATNTEIIPKLNNNIFILNISNKHNLGNLIEEL